MRGKHISKSPFFPSSRITPAYAGKTTVTALKAEREQDHPRVCGENYRLPRREYRPVGSPPRMRGKLSLFSGIVRITGITPAYAGKTHN